MRGTLRSRPLPEGVGELIELAADVPQRVAEACMLCGEPPLQVREAARFYVREVLLFPNADAYRVLGVSKTASAAQIKLHYRRLQHWLHPDRRGDEWESVFATRINQAWGQLRSPARRAAYDARQPLAVTAERDDTPQRVAVGEWRQVPGDDFPRREWMLPAAAIAGCLGLALLLVLKYEAPAPDWGVQTDPSAEVLTQTLATTANATVGKLQTHLHAATDMTPARQPAPTSDEALLRGVMPLPATQVTGLEPGVGSPAVPFTELPRPSRSKKPEKSAGSKVEAADIHIVLPLGATTTAVMAVATPDASTAVVTSSVDRFRRALRRGDEVTHYLASRTAKAPPIWHGVAALDEATGLRERLGEGRLRLSRSVHFDDAQWQIGGEHVRMTAAIRRGGRAESGILQVDLIWRDHMWLVEQVRVEGL